MEVDMRVKEGGQSVFQDTLMDVEGEVTSGSEASSCEHASAPMMVWGKEQGWSPLLSPAWW